MAKKILISFALFMFAIAPALHAANGGNGGNGGNGSKGGGNGGRGGKGLLLNGKDGTNGEKK